MAKKHNTTKEPAWMKSFEALGSRKFVLLLTDGEKVEQQNRIKGRRRMTRSITLDPQLVVEWLVQAAADRKSPNNFLAKMLCENWGYRKEDV